MSQVQDEFSGGEVIDTYSILSSVFLIDGRIYKHYRLLQWFPKYLRYFFQSQCLLMDNNEGGDEAFSNQAETGVFPKHVNYYLAIMAVSCYRQEYLLYLL